MSGSGKMTEPFDRGDSRAQGCLPIFYNNVHGASFLLPVVPAKRVDWDMDRVIEAKRDGHEGPYFDVYVIRPGKEDWDLLEPIEYGCYWVQWVNAKEGVA